MNVFELIKEKLEEAKGKDVCDDISCSLCHERYKTDSSDDCYHPIQMLVYDNVISIVDEVAQEFEGKYLIVPKDDFTEDLLNMGYTKGIKDGYNKAIDEFVERLSGKIKYEIDDCADELDWIDEIAEQLKGGSDK